MDRGQIQEALAKELQADARLAAAYLFGSVARGTAGPGSDVDVGLLYRVPPGAGLLEQPFAREGELSARLGRPVQLVLMNGAPPDLVHRILRDGILLFENDRSARIAFEVRARNEYFDLLPILRQYRKRAGA